MKYYILERGHARTENTLHACDTESERDALTQELIYGEAADGADEQEQWRKYREELNETGSLEFEGDPGLEWFTAQPAAGLNAAYQPPKGEARRLAGDAGSVASP